MAAGRGNRMRPLTDKIPKPMIPYNGSTLIGNSLGMLQRSIEHIYITVGYKKAMLAKYLMALGVETIINTEGHGNAWWITNTLMKFVDEPVLVLTTDNVTEIRLDFIEDEYARLGFPICMLIPVTPIDGIEGDFIEEENGIVKTIQRENYKDIYASGIQVLKPSIIAEKIGRTNDFSVLWRNLIDLGELRVCQTYPYNWFSVDTLEQLAMLNQKNLDR